MPSAAAARNPSSSLHLIWPSSSLRNGERHLPFFLPSKQRPPSSSIRNSDRHLPPSETGTPICLSSSLRNGDTHLRRNPSIAPLKSQLLQSSEVASLRPSLNPYLCSRLLPSSLPKSIPLQPSPPFVPPFATVSSLNRVPLSQLLFPKSHPVVAAPLPQITSQCQLLSLSSAKLRWSGWTSRCH